MPTLTPVSNAQIAQIEAAVLAELPAFIARRFRVSDADARAIAARIAPNITAQKPAVTPTAPQSVAPAQESPFSRSIKEVQEFLSSAQAEQNYIKGLNLDAQTDYMRGGGVASLIADAYGRARYAAETALKAAQTDRQKKFAYSLIFQSKEGQATWKNAQ